MVTRARRRFHQSYHFQISLNLNTSSSEDFLERNFKETVERS